MHRRQVVVISREDQEYFRQLRESQDAKAQAHGADVFRWTWRHYIKLMEASERRGPELSH